MSKKNILSKKKSVPSVLSQIELLNTEAQENYIEFKRNFTEFEQLATRLQSLKSKAPKETYIQKFQEKKKIFFQNQLTSIKSKLPDNMLLDHGMEDLATIKTISITEHDINQAEITSTRTIVFIRLIKLATDEIKIANSHNELLKILTSIFTFSQAIRMENKFDQKDYLLIKSFNLIEVGFNKLQTQEISFNEEEKKSIRDLVDNISEILNKVKSNNRFKIIFTYLIPLYKLVKDQQLELTQKITPILTQAFDLFYISYKKKIIDNCNLDFSIFLNFSKIYLNELTNLLIAAPKDFIGPAKEKLIQIAEFIIDYFYDMVEALNEKNEPINTLIYNIFSCLNLITQQILKHNILKLSEKYSEWLKSVLAAFILLNDALDENTVFPHLLTLAEKPEINLATLFHDLINFTHHSSAGCSEHILTKLQLICDKLTPEITSIDFKLKVHLEPTTNQEENPKILPAITETMANLAYNVQNQEIDLNNCKDIFSTIDLFQLTLQALPQRALDAEIYLAIKNEVELRLSTFYSMIAKKAKEQLKILLSAELINTTAGLTERLLDTLKLEASLLELSDKIPTLEYKIKEIKNIKAQFGFKFIALLVNQQEPETADKNEILDKIFLILLMTLAIQTQPEIKEETLVNLTTIRNKLLDSLRTKLSKAQIDYFFIKVAGLPENPFQLSHYTILLTFFHLFLSLPMTRDNKKYLKDTILSYTTKINTSLQDFFNNSLDNFYRKTKNRFAYNRFNIINNKLNILDTTMLNRRFNEISVSETDFYKEFFRIYTETLTENNNYSKESQQSNSNITEEETDKEKHEKCLEEAFFIHSLNDIFLEKINSISFPALDTKSVFYLSFRTYIENIIDCFIRVDNELWTIIFFNNHLTSKQVKPLLHRVESFLTLANKFGLNSCSYFLTLSKIRLTYFVTDHDIYHDLKKFFKDQSACLALVTLTNQLNKIKEEIQADFVLKKKEKKDLYLLLTESYFKLCEIGYEQISQAENKEFRIDLVAAYITYEQKLAYYENLIQESKFLETIKPSLDTLLHLIQLISPCRPQDVQIIEMIKEGVSLCQQHNDYLSQMLKILANDVSYYELPVSSPESETEDTPEQHENLEVLSEYQNDLSSTENEDNAIGFPLEVSLTLSSEEEAGPSTKSVIEENNSRSTNQETEIEAPVIVNIPIASNANEENGSSSTNESILLTNANSIAHLIIEHSEEVISKKSEEHKPYIEEASCSSSAADESYLTEPPSERKIQKTIKLITRLEKVIKRFPLAAQENNQAENEYKAPYFQHHAYLTAILYSLNSLNKNRHVFTIFELSAFTKVIFSYFLFRGVYNDPDLIFLQNSSRALINALSYWINTTRPLQLPNHKNSVLFSILEEKSPAHANTLKTLHKAYWNCTIKGTFFYNAGYTAPAQERKQEMLEGINQIPRSFEI